ncbi:hypothetical protein BCV69DRAFT_301879 [Microstroma glucosiphilum]|uniref:Uncharacterized protein n=1 Tax=Pseudomicrostroma glucosiphilum TaxID=1684307 RepID=A0A316TZY9_9BASI|nr:hypothetical protein BCV69DRAFT_301879 [Pseudomicrostroma glucosiphilum]PWN17871.1 hypothetical protein BCV69DRAFT_301879 [Pseudomicrostroma glucosiphilum]
MLFEGRDYLLWKQRMHDALALKGLLHTATHPLPEASADWQKRDDREARAVIAQTLGDVVLQRIPSCAHTDTHKLLRYLEAAYETLSTEIAFAEFHELRCKDVRRVVPAGQLKAVQDYLDKMSGLRKEAGGKDRIPDHVFCRALHCGLVNQLSPKTGLFERMTSLYGTVGFEEALYSSIYRNIQARDS